MSALSGSGVAGPHLRRGRRPVALVWLACRLFPRLPAAVRCGLWWAACLKLLVGLVRDRSGAGAAVAGASTNR